MATIIFDLNRTLYNPETDGAIPGALEAVRLLRKRGHILHVVSRPEAGRADILTRLGIADLFATASYVLDKEPAMHRIKQFSEGPVYMVGDHLQSDIRAGNRCGVQTIWFKHGAFMDLIPEIHDDVPWRTIKRMEELQDLID